MQEIVPRVEFETFAQVELNHCHQRDGLRPGSIADANEALRTATNQFGELEVPGELPKRRVGIGGKILDTAALLQQVPALPVGNTLKMGISRDQKEIVIPLLP